VLPPEDKVRVAEVLEQDAQIVTDAQLDSLLDEQPQEIQDEILRINDEARDLALQVALLVPIIAALLGFLNSFRMAREPEPEPSADLEGMVLG
jgi:hypothetical protein